MEPVLLLFFFVFWIVFAAVQTLSTTASPAEEANGNCAACFGQGNKRGPVNAPPFPSAAILCAFCGIGYRSFFRVYLSVSFFGKPTSEQQEPKMFASAAVRSCPENFNLYGKILYIYICLDPIFVIPIFLSILKKMLKL